MKKMKELKIEINELFEKIVESTEQEKQDDLRNEYRQKIQNYRFLVELPEQI